jgi:hypothetical protein
LLTHHFPLASYRQAYAVAADKRKYRSITVAFEEDRLADTQRIDERQSRSRQVNVGSVWLAEAREGIKWQQQQ